MVEKELLKQSSRDLVFDEEYPEILIKKMENFTVTYEQRWPMKEI